MFGVYPKGRYAINLNAARRGDALDDDGVRAAIAPLVDIVGPLSTEKLTGYPSFVADAVLDGIKRDAVFAAMRHYVEICIQRPAN